MSPSLGALPEGAQYAGYIVGLKGRRTNVMYPVWLHNLVHGRRAGSARCREQGDTMTTLNQAAAQQADGTLNIV